MTREELIAAARSAPREVLPELTISEIEDSLRAAMAALSTIGGIPGGPTESARAHIGKAILALISARLEHGSLPATDAWRWRVDGGAELEIEAAVAAMGGYPGYTRRMLLSHLRPGDSWTGPEGRRAVRFR